MIRYIKIEDSNNRDAELTFKSVRTVNTIFLAMENGEKPISKKIIRSSKEKNLKSLLKKNDASQDDYNNFSEVLISSDSEIDFELFGKFIVKTERIYTTESFDPVFNINVTEKILNPKGEVTEERKPNYLKSNISGENIIK